MEEYAEKSAKLRNDYGDPVEEFEIQFIDGELIDCELGNAWGVYQSNLDEIFDAVADWDDDHKTRFIIAVGECGYSTEQASDPGSIDIDIYALDSLKELAEQFVDEGLFGDIPERLQFYLDYDLIARDLGMNYSETTVNGTNLIYRCG